MPTPINDQIVLGTDASGNKGISMVSDSLSILQDTNLGLKRIIPDQTKLQICTYRDQYRPLVYLACAMNHTIWFNYSPVILDVNQTLIKINL